jgi:hypothetical protein
LRRRMIIDARAQVKFIDIICEFLDDTILVNDSMQVWSFFYDTLFEGTSLLHTYTHEA